MTLTAQYRPYRDDVDGLDGVDNSDLSWPDNEIGTIQIYEKTTEDIPFVSNRRLLCGVVMLSVLTLLTGFLIGYFAHSTHSECVPNLAMSLHAVRDENPTIRSKILQRVNAKSIRSVIKEFSRESRLAASDNDLRIAIQVKNFLKAHHFDKTELKNYSVLLSIPESNESNFIEIIDQNQNKSIYSSLNADNKDSDSLGAFCAYSPNIDIKSSVIFVNYGRLVDYQILQNAYNITRDTIAGNILIAKQFHLTADEQMAYAQQMGAAALLLYPDPENYNPPKLKAKPYPESPYMPPDAIRLDSLLWNGLGDPQTPGYAATPYAHRLPLSSINLPSIAVQPISYTTALEILSRLDGKKAPNDWNIGSNVSYYLGPGFRNDGSSNFTLHLKVANSLVNKTIYNVIGSIRGRVEPDRYVIIGNHRDAWFKGAIDSAAGTAAFLELSRIFGDLLVEGWRPRRSILFCSWGAEEFNLIGSTEWIEENQKILNSRAVAYINSDIIVIGNGSLSVAASPLLYHAIFNATKEVINPNEEDEAKTVYDKWLISYPLMRNTSGMISPKQSAFDADIDLISDLSNANKHLKEEPNESGYLLRTYLESAVLQIRPKVRQLDMRSSYAPFFIMSGIPALDITYTSSNDFRGESYNQINSMSYPLLHTKYDTFDLIEKFIDPDFRYHKAVTQVLGEILRDLADSLFIPFNLLDYAQVLKDLYITLYIHTETILTNNGINIELLDLAIKNFTKAAVKFHSKQDKLDFKDPMAIRRINDQLMLIERTFLDTNGLPRNMMKRHIVLSPGEVDPPYDEMFPGLMDEFAVLLQHPGTGVKTQWSWDVIRAHFSILVATIDNASNAISDVI
ncbi:putative N-acetylated-alpha-linked acidic dipeptidase [Oppia nitens]|uniref:putative N-acetylated-alpha-linked acidic dipeptidase n=1 Tax=Oppia nitens TaxID=1686743 RepID=UPI0023D9C79A|nr:putative N-acetylated-alpha-linked acidic dipeptidase [Oppia nitens]